MRFDRWWSGQNSHVVDLARGASVAGLLKGVAFVLTFGLNVVIGRTLGAEAAGIYFLALTTATIAATIGRVGLESTVVRFIAGYASSDRWSDVERVNRLAIVICLVSSIVVAAVQFFASDLLAVALFSDPTVAEPMRAMAFAVVPLAVSVLVSKSLQGLSRIRDSVVVLSILPTALALVGTWGLAPHWGVEGAAFAYVAALVAAWIYGWHAWRRAWAGRPQAQAFEPKGQLAQELLKSGTPLLIGALLQLVIQMSGTLMLGIWADNSHVSVFAIAWRTAVLITFVLIAVNTSAQPKFAALFARGDMESLASTARKATMIMTLGAAPVLAVFLLAPALVMSAFGSDFADGAATLQILSIGQFVNVATGSVGVLLVMSGHEREYRNVQIVAAAIVMALNVALIPPYGAVGAAIATSAALIVQNLLFGYFVWAKLGILLMTPRALIRRFRR